MSLPVDRWQWEQLIMSKHGPPSTSVRLALVAIAACAANSQTQAWPSQDLIAERAGLSPRQVKRLLQDAEELSWVRRTMAHKPGQRWRYTVYDFCVPPHLLNEIPAHPWENNPTWQRGDAHDTSSANKVSPVTPSQGKAPSKPLNGGTNGAHKVTSAADKVTKAPSDKVTNGADEVTQLWPMKSPSEVPSKASIQASTHGALTSTARAMGTLNETKGQEPAERQRKILVLLKAGRAPADALHALKKAGATPEDLIAAVEQYDATRAGGTA